MLEPLELLDELEPSASALAGLRVVVSAGPTLEDLDPVRYLGNRSSGKMGFAIAAEAAAAGASVDLIAGPVHLTTPRGCRRTDVRSALQMHAAVMQACVGADIYVGAAAVADYRPVVSNLHKIKKSQDRLSLELVRNPDIIAQLGSLSPRPYLVGFAAETQDVLAYARGKLEKKGLDLVVANRVGPDAAFDREDNAVTVVASDGDYDLGHADKRELARRLWTLICARRSTPAVTGHSVLPA